MASLSLVFDLLARDKASSKFRDVGDAADRAGRSAGGFGSSIGSAMKLAAGAIAAAGIGRAFAGFVQDAEESAKIGRLTAAVITSTGGAAKISADQVSALATSISNKTAVDDEAIQSASNLLLTFTKVRNETGKGNDIFNQATQAAIDMSTAMGTDANGAALQLGKALNDPVKGVTALSKAGVSFTQQQKDQIKAMVAAGDTLGAQKIILGEMQTQFGGAAAAAASPMERLKVIAGNLGESIGGALLPAVGAFSNFLADKAIPTLGRMWSALAEKVGPVLGTVRDAVLGFMGAFTGNGSDALERFSGPTMNRIIDAASFARRVFDELVGGIRSFAAAWKYNDGEVTSSGFPGFMERLGYAAHQAFDYIKGSVIPTLVDFGGWIKRNADIILPFVAALGAGYVVFRTITAITKAWAAAQALLNVMMAANPIGLVIVAIAALVAGLVVAYQRSETFREIVDAAFRAIAAAGRWMWETVLQPAFEAIQRAWVSVADDVDNAWENVIKPAWSAVVAYAGFMWNNVLKPYFTFIINLWIEVAQGVMWAWSNVLQPAWTAVVAYVQFMWNNVISPYFNFIWDLWSKVAQGIKWAYDNIISPVWGAFKTGVEGLQRVFQTVKDAIANIWNGLVEAVKAPIRVTFEFVNDKMVGPINSLLGKFPGNLSIPMLPRLAGGGLVRGPGSGTSDSILGVDPRTGLPTAWVSNKEFVVNAAATERNRDLLEAINSGAIAQYRRGGEIGGPFDFVGDAANWVGDKASDAAGWVADMAVKGARVVAAQILNPLRDAAKNLTPNNVIGNVLDGSIDRLVNAVLGKSDEYDSANKGGQGGGSFNGPIGNGAVGGGWKSIWDFVSARIPQARINSTYRPGDPGYHGKGKAVDFGFGSGPGGAGSPGLASIKRLLHDSLGGNLAELIYNGVGNDRSNLKNGKPLAYSAATQAEHRNHVHAAVYDQGGLLPPGFTMAYNGTGRNETIRTAEQEAALQGGPMQVTLQLDREAVTDLLDGRVVAVLDTTIQRGAFNG